ncbi:MAG: SDR family oxidoreductase [Burkholderiales bacterium]|nr:SDR family oxidoreductase [Burkholderiales bacterium]
MATMSNAPRILVTGAAGYIGTVLVGQLLAAGQRVLAVDRMHFGDEALAPFGINPNFSLLRADVSALETEHLRNVSAVVDLAAISSDPAARLDPAWTERVNHRGRVRLASLAQACGVRRHILVSSCSVYGQGGNNGEVDEDSAPHPLSSYTRAAVAAEAGVLALAGDGLCATVLRLGTVHGLSRRMRFDLVVNTMTLAAVRQRQITLHGGGRQWRPHVHVDDVARAVLATLSAAPWHIGGQIFNIGQNNLRVRDVAEVVRQVVQDQLGGQIAVLDDGLAPIITTTA